jgi:uncharacterized protein (DUF2062 family)/2-polyprenyl-3-methyl-5-hydroxy-6-metoxy-1,4-benzoquinol methylase
LDNSSLSPIQPGAFRRLVRDLRVEGGGRGEQAVAVGVGVLIGCLPLWGLHLAICVVIGRLFRLNRVKMYAAANISNPFFAPFLIAASVQIGSLLRRGSLYGVSWSEWRHVDPLSFGADYVMGSVVLGLLLGAGAALATWTLTRPASATHALLAAAADRYLVASITAWEFARNKLRGDPLYAAVVLGGHLPAEGRLLDVGCGQGLLLAALATAREWHERGRWPASWPTPPRLALEGFDLRARPVEVAKIALAGDAVVTRADARAGLDAGRGSVAAITVCDVLHLMARDEQDDLLRSAVAALTHGGVLVVREADAACGWRFNLVRVGNLITGLSRGRWQRFAFRTGREWLEALRGLGLDVDVLPAGTVFANVLLVGRMPRDRSR